MIFASFPQVARYSPLSLSGLTNHVGLAQLHGGVTNNMKKFLGIMMVIAVFGAVLGGCAAEENTDNGTETTTPAEGGGEGTNTSM